MGNGTVNIYKRQEKNQIRMNKPKQYPPYSILKRWNSKFIYLIAIITALAATTSPAQAQTVDVCGSDTLILSAGNYQYAPIQWQESYNLTDWTNIPNAQDTTYTFFPTETKYYRAKVTYSECPPEYSEISLVQLPPQADAGGDRSVPGSLVSLTANAEAGATGTWSILSGTGGSFSDINAPQSQFIGNDTMYTLVYSLANACGTDSDMAEVRFHQNTYVSNIVVVDTTDLVLSDTSQIAQGEYKIHFSSPVPIITDSTYLVGIVNDGFLRQVTSFTVQADTFTMQTAPATLEDIIVNGAINAAQTFAVDTTTGKTSYSPQRLDHAPTRHELNTDAKFQTGEVFYYYPDENVEYIRSGITLSSKMKSANNYLIDVNFNSTLIDSGGSSIQLSGHYKFEPNIVADMEFQGLTLNTANIGMYNGIIDQNYQVSLTAASATNLLNHPFTLLSISKPVIMVIGGVPVYIIATLKLNGKVSANISASMNITHDYTKTSTHSATLEYLNQQWNYNYSESSQVTTDNSLSVTGNLTQNFKIGPELTFKIYNIVGPYVEAKLTENLNLCTDLSANWSAGMNIGGYIKVGVKAEVPAWTIFDVYHIWAQDFYSIQFPHDIAIESGNNQNYTAGSALPNSIQVKVSANQGWAVPYATVHFSPQDGGSVASSTVTADNNGIATTTWTPGGNAQSQLEVSVVDCNGNLVSNAPILFQANETGQGNNCITSSLSVSISQNGNTISPIAHIGVPPFTYSTDGVNYNAPVPQITTTPGQAYTFYVKDANNCTASESYYVPADACTNSNLSLNVEVSASTLTATAQGGAPPYLYALDAGSYTSNNVFSNVALGAHDVLVKDADACISSTGITVTTTSQTNGCNNGLATVTDIDGNVYNVVEIGGQCWTQENLRTTKYANGDNIPNVTDNAQWGSLTNGSWCYYDNDNTIGNLYGKLYNWFAVDDARSICPNGWHVPSDDEWMTLEMELGMSLQNAQSGGYRGTDEGGKMKEIGFNHWQSPNTGSTNSSGLTVLPGGFRSNSGISYSLETEANFWNSDNIGPGWQRHRYLAYDRSTIGRLTILREMGFSCRCVKD